MSPARKTEFRNILFKAQGGRCCYCGKGLLMPGKHGWKEGQQHRPNAATLEHLRRTCDGGTNHPDNLALACKSCNSGRGSMSWVEFKTIKARAA